MTPYSLSSTNRETALSQFVSIERYTRGVYVRVTCPSIGQREAPIITAEVGEALATGDMPKGGTLVLDLSAVVMLTSMGLGMCIDLRRRAETAKLKPHLFGMSRQLLDVLRMMKIDRQYTVMHGKEELGALLG